MERVEIANVNPDHAARVLDLERRLKDIPASAMTRGVFFNMIQDNLERRGLAGAPAWQKLHGCRRGVYTFYPVTDFVVAFATAGALVHPDPREGVREIFSSGARYFSLTWFGQMFQKFLRPDPASALQWLERSRDRLCNYGRWQVEKRGPGHVTLHMFDEYIWIDSGHRGGCEGMLAACGVIGEVRPEMDGPFQGRLEVTWEPRH